MPSNTIKKLIEDYSDTMLKTNPFAIAAKNGTLTSKQFEIYLRNLMWIFQRHSERLLPAIKRSQELRLDDVVAFMKEKYVEELDHYQWPQQDLRNLGVVVEAESEDYVTLSAKNLISYVDFLIEKNPVLFISYMVLVEYFTVLAAPEFLKNLELNCGIQPSQITAISKHILADEKHVSDDFEIISKVVRNADQKNGMILSLKQGIKLLDQFFCDCAGAAA